MTKCLGCRCPAPTTNRRCACCGAWPSELECAACGKAARFDVDLLLTTHGPVCDGCWRVLGSDPTELTFAAEKLRDERALNVVAKHESPLVREGAVYGLAKLRTATARSTLALIAANDPSPGVRAAAVEALEP
jgi:HEAT repeats